MLFLKIVQVLKTNLKLVIDTINIYYSHLDHYIIIMSRFPLVESSRASLNRKSESSNSYSLNSRPYEFRKRKIHADRQEVKRYRGSSRPNKICNTYRRSKSPDSTRSTSQPRLKDHPSKISRENNFIDTFKPRNPYYSILPLEWWERSEDCKEAKSKHVSKIDRLCKNREFLVLNTTLYKQNIVLEPNMFPCKFSSSFHPHVIIIFTNVLKI